jgi:uncharacterized protein (DUF433 family)
MQSDPASIACSDPSVLGGTVVFCGTRVPFSTFIEYLEGGSTVDGFLADFPSVSREQAVGALELLGTTMIERIGRGEDDPRASVA